MSDLKSQVRELMKRVRERGQLPSSSAVVAETFARLGYTKRSIAPDDVITNFNERLLSLWKETLVTLELHEARTYEEGIPAEMIEAFPREF